MEFKKPYPGMLMLAVIAMLVLGLIAILVVNRADHSRSQVPIFAQLSDFEFTAAHSGQPFGLQQMQGKLNVVDFIFTSCPSICPIMAVNMSELYELYRNSDKVQFVSISVDPDRDSLEALIEYGRSLGVDDNRWVFLRAPVEQVIEVCEEQFMLAAEALPMGHTTKFILVDQHGRIRSYHEGLKNESMLALKNNIKQLSREMR